jgi:hypothetical protein
MAGTQGRRRSGATSSPEDEAMPSPFGRLNKRSFIDGPVTDGGLGESRGQLANEHADRRGGIF